MKTSLPSFVKTFISTIVLSVVLFISHNAVAQPGTDVLDNGLDFSKDPVLLTSSYTDLKQGALYLFEDVAPGIDARIKIDSLVNGARVIDIDNNSNGLGYKEALQPEIRTGNVIGKSYVVFTISFYKAGTTIPEMMRSVNATALDIDGNVNLKEFADINVGNGGLATYMSTTSDLSLLQMLTGRFMGQNILGIERSGIDTSSYANMFTVSNNSGISSMTVRYGAFTVLATQTTRQFSLYMKGFAYPDQVTLPVELLSFSAVLNDNRVDLKWSTASEKNVSHFVVEKSLDGRNYSDAGIVFAYGNTSEKMDYSFPDKNINTSQTAVIYYRLRSVDNDSKSQYSPIRMIRIAKQSEKAISILTYPNPVASELRITVPANWQGKRVSYEILDNNGRLLIRNESGSSSQTEAINVGSLNVGVYLVRVSCNGETTVQQIIKK